MHTVSHIKHRFTLQSIQTDSNKFDINKHESKSKLCKEESRSFATDWISFVPVEMYVFEWVVPGCGWVKEKAACVHILLSFPALEAC